jgi:RloB-like protein
MGYNYNNRKPEKKVNRPGNSESPRKRYLIVCEGSKTEKYYFEDLRDDKGLSSKNVRIVHAGPDPVTIVKEALKLFKSEKDDTFDEVFCVFDQEHDSFEQAVNRINDLSPKKPFHAITSMPCFEFWLLLHFEYTAQPFNKMPTKSLGKQAEVLLKLKLGFKNYKKSDRVYKILSGKTQEAIENAQKLEKSPHGENPSTRVHRLVLALQALASSNS